MDPQAVITRMIDCINDADELRQCFEDLRNWLKKGGFAPIVTFATFGTTILISKGLGVTYHIQTVLESGIQVKPAQYEFAVYGANGLLIEIYRLAS